MKSDAWVDIHAHVAGLARFGVDPEAYGARQGVGVLVDAGSAPPAELAHRLESIAGSTSTTVLAWANICTEGIAGEGCAAHDISGAGAREALLRERSRLVGIKLQASNTRLGARAMQAIDNAKSVAGEVGVPLMVHVGNAPPPLREVADALRPGDIITHFAHGKPDGAVEGGHVHRSLRLARDRGVLFDLGHGAGSFSFDVMQALLADGFPPDTISTDLHAGSAARPVGSLADCMSKLLCLGMSEEAVIAAVTDTPRRALQLPPAARSTSFEVRDERWLATDSFGATRELVRRFRPEPIDG
jgi:dihydroorotase